jgi:alcohol dehydrogenase (cytochrome c)
MDMKRFLCLLSIFVFFGAAGDCQSAAVGQTVFQRNCATCHGGDGLGGEMGPNIAGRQAGMNDEQLEKVLHDGEMNLGMPAFPSIAGQEKTDLIAFIRTIRSQQRPAPLSRTVEMVNGEKLTGLVLNESPEDLQLRTANEQIRLLRPVDGKYREVISQTDWTTYNGTTTANRFSTLDQITKQNVSGLVPKWVFPMEGTTPHNETTPIVVQGIMYVTSANECWALDAGSGREIWHFKRPRTVGLIGNASQGINRGVAWLGDRVFMVTDNAHLLALNRLTGDVVWETVMADWHQNYNATGAPLIADNLVISGTAGGEQGVRGFVAAYNPKDGKEVWRFWTVPNPGEPGSETWVGKALEHPSAVTWMTGSYDPELDMLYWGTGNPGPDYNGDDRQGDNLYSDSILALDPHTGKMKWYYQATPHDIHDWDSTQPLVLIDRDWQGSPRKLLLQANRNGFFYVLDRENGKVLLGKTFVHNVNWAKELDASGKPIPLPLPNDPNSRATHVCPWVWGATNWFSTTYDPASGHYIVQTFEGCGHYVSLPTGEWLPGRGYSGGSQRVDRDPAPQEVLRAIDITTGKIVWELPEFGIATSLGGTLGFANGVVFFCADGGIFTAVDSSNGKILWQFQTNVDFKASPMTYVFDGKQYVAVNAGQNIIAFALFK